MSIFMTANKTQVGDNPFEQFKAPPQKDPTIKTIKLSR
jgi:hypothetical protein